MGVLSWLFKKAEDKIQPVMAGIPGVQNIIGNTIGSAISETLKGNALSNLKGNLQALSNPATADQWSKGFNYSPTGIAQNFITSWYGKPLAQLPGNIKQTAQGIQEGDWLKAGEGAGKTALGLLGAIPDPTDIPIAGYNAVKGFSAGMQEKDRTPASVAKKTVDALTFNDPIGAGTAFLKPQYGKVGEDVGNILELPAMLAVGSVRAKGEARNIKSAQELASTVAKNMGKKAGEGVTLPLRTLLKSFNLTDDMLESLDKGTLNGKGFSIQKLGNQVEFIFDEGFKPGSIKVAPRVEPKVKVKTPQVVAPIVQDVAPQVGRSEFKLQPGETTEQMIARIKGRPLASGGIDEVWSKLRPSLKTQFDEALTQRNRKEVARLLPEIPDTYKQTWKTQIDDVLEPKLLVGDTKPLTQKDAIRIFKKTGEAQPFVNKLPSDTEPIQLEQRLLPGGVEPLTPRDAVTIGKKTGEAVPFVNELPAGTKPIRLLETIEETRSTKAPTPKQDRVLGNTYFDLQKIKKYIGDVPRVVASFLDPSRLMENTGITKGSETVKNFLRTNVIEPLWKANNDYANDIRTWGKRMQSDIVDKFKLTDNDFESVLKYGETDDKVQALASLQESNPHNWEQIVEADKSFRTIFDELFSIWNKKRTQLGLPEIPYIENYYRRAREGGLFVPGNMVNQVLDSTGGMDYKFFGAERSRTGGSNYSKNAMYALQNYVQGVLAQIHYTPVIQKETQLAGVLADTSPELARWFKKHADIMSGTYKNFFTQLISGLGDTGQNVIKTAIKNVGKNLVTSATVALSNIGANVYTIAEVGEKNFARAIKKVLFGSDFMNDYTTGGVQSQFLNTRYVDDINFYKNTPDKIYNVLSKPAQLFDKFTAEVAVTAKKDQLLAQGVPLDQAVRQADEWTSRMMANRAQGMLPTAMQEYNPLSMFATEPINQIHYLFETAKAKGDKNAMTGALYMTKLFTYVYLFNSLYEQATGRRLMVDPINLITSVAGEVIGSDDTETKIKDIARAVLDEVPIIGRSTIPVTSAIQTGDDIKDDPIKALARIGMLFNPAGGLSQIAKSEEGIKNYAQGYDEVKAGERIKYPIRQDLFNLARAVISGTHSFPEARQYFDKGYTALDDNDTMIIKSLQSIGEEEARRRGIPFDVGNDAAIKYYESIRDRGEGQQFRSRVEALKTEAKYVFANPASTEEDIRRAQTKFAEGVQDIAQDMRIYAAQKQGNIIDQAKAMIGLQPQTPQIQTPDAPRIDRTTPQATTIADQATLNAYASMPQPQARAGSGASIKVGSIKKLSKLKLPSLSTAQSKTTQAMSNQGVKIKPITPRKQPKLRTRR